jgi:uncharacterized lipoprotein
MKRKWQIVLLAFFITALAACSDKTPAQKSAAEKENFLSEKMETIKKAEAVDQMIQDAAAQQRRNIEDQGG